MEVDLLHSNTSSPPPNYRTNESPEKSDYIIEEQINLSPFYRKSDNMNGHQRHDTQTTHYSNFNQILGSTYKLLDEIKANSTKNSTNALKFSHIKSPTRASLNVTYKSPLKTSFFEQRSLELSGSQLRSSTIRLPKKDSKMVIEESYKLISEIKSSLKNSRTAIARYGNHTEYMAPVNLYTEPDVQTEAKKQVRNKGREKENRSISPYQAKQEDTVFSEKYLVNKSHDKENERGKDIIARLNRDAKNSYNNLVNEVLENLDNRQSSPPRGQEIEFGIDSSSRQNRSASRRYQEESVDPMSYSNSPKYQDENLGNSFGSSYLKNSLQANSKRIEMPMNSKAEPYDPLAAALELEEESPKPNTNLTLQPQPQPTVQAGKLTLTLTSYYPKPTREVKKDNKNNFQKSYDGLRNSRFNESTNSLKNSQEVMDSYRSNKSMKGSNVGKKGQQDKSNRSANRVGFY